jgi:hypothetical protein
MRRLFLLIFVFLAACAPVATPVAAPLFAYIRLDAAPALVLTDKPASGALLGEIPLTAPANCELWSLNPAPIGQRAALEWECESGPRVQMIDIRAKTSAFLLGDPALDNRFLAWNPDGTAVYLKAGMLSSPQVLRAAVDSRSVVVLPASPYTYDLTVAPDGTVLYAASAGLGYGSEVWQLGNPSRRFLSDAENILGLFRYAPDGKHLAYIRLPDSQEEFPAGELWVRDADGKNPLLAATADAGRGMPPVWSPGGDQIAFVGRNRPADPSTNLSIYTLDTGALLTLAFAPVMPPVWEPDGLYFTQAENDTMTVWYYDTASGQARPVVSGACCAGWIR